MVKVVLACAIVLLAGCGRDGFEPSGSDTDAEVCENILCEGHWPPPVGLVDGGTDEDAAVQEGEPDGGPAPEDDAGNRPDGGQEPETDGSTGDGAVPGALAPETLTGRWTVSTAVLKMCGSVTNDETREKLVDGPGVYITRAPIRIDAALNATWLYSEIASTQDVVFDYVSFDGATLIAAKEAEAGASRPTRGVLEVTFSDEDTFEGVFTTEGVDGFCPCGGDDCGEPLQAVRGVREAAP